MLHEENLNNLIVKRIKRYYRNLEHYIKMFLYMMHVKTKMRFNEQNVITFLCHGNICRSAFCEHYVKRFNLGDTIRFYSCGLYADQGNRSPQDSIQAAKTFGVDLSEHIPQKITRKIVEESSVIFGMDYSNYYDFIREFPEHASKFHLIKEVGFFNKYDIVRDPYAGNITDYTQCYATLIDSLTILLNKLSGSRSEGKKNIMIVTGALSYGGLERVVLNLAKYVTKEYNPYTICMHNKGEQAKELLELMLPVVALNEDKKRWTNYTSFLKIRKIIQEEKIAVVHTHNTGPFLSSALAMLFMKQKPVFIHTDHARKYPDKTRYMVGEKLASYLADKIIAVSQETKDNLIKYEHINPEKIEIINNGIDKNRYDIQVDKNYKLEQIGAKGFDHYIGLGVVLTDQKGIRYLIDAMPEILKAYPRTALLIAGDGPERKKLEDQVAIMELGDNVFFLGMRDDIPEILQLLDIFVLPSEWEGLPLVILEAMAAKRCILATDVGGLSIAIKSGENGVLVPAKKPEALSNEIKRMLSNRQYREDLALNAYKDFIEYFSADKMARSYEQYYSDYQNSHKRV